MVGAGRACYWAAIDTKGTFYGRQEYTTETLHRGVSGLQAAKLIVEGGYTYHQASQQLGVSDWALRGWVKAFRDSGHLPVKGQVVPLAERLQDGPSGADPTAAGE